MRNLFYLLVIVPLFLLNACNSNSREKKEKPAVLLADREAPLGWVYLRMYEDRSFEFISRGLREEEVYPGTFRLSGDTVFFQYENAIPRAGRTAVIGENVVSYIDGSYHESVGIKLNRLEK